MICVNCLREYKTQAAFDRHVESKSCLTLRDKLEWSDLEALMFRVYSELTETTKSKPRLSVFRSKAAAYNWAYKFVRLCQRHKMGERLILMYAAFCKHTNDTTSMTLFRGTKRSTLLSFRKFLIDNPEYIDSERYFKENERQLLLDLSFGIASIRAAKISFEYWKSHVESSILLEGATPVEINLLDKLVGEMEAKQC